MCVCVCVGGGGGGGGVLYCDVFNSFYGGGVEEKSALLHDPTKMLDFLI